MLRPAALTFVGERGLIGCDPSLRCDRLYHHHHQAVLCTASCAPPLPSWSDEWIKKLEDPKMWDQNAFNDLVRIGHKPSNRSMGNLW